MTTPKEIQKLEKYIRGFPNATQDDLLEEFSDFSSEQIEYHYNRLNTSLDNEKSSIKIQSDQIFKHIFHNQDLIPSEVHRAFPDVPLSNIRNIFSRYKKYIAPLFEIIEENPGKTDREIKKLKEVVDLGVGLKYINFAQEFLKEGLQEPSEELENNSNDGNKTIVNKEPVKKKIKKMADSSDIDTDEIKKLRKEVQNNNKIISEMSGKIDEISNMLNKFLGIDSSLLKKDSNLDLDMIIKMQKLKLLKEFLNE